ncbi:MAG: thioredoxin-disulfide reductase [Chloroflexota bacterium]|nr:thioredoxin-disulfide reductase [Chloroflexota bacterium]
MRSCDIAIIGSGTAGLSAAVYAARANMSTLVFTGEAFGGQIATTHDVENYPGFEDGITGPELTERMKAQAERFGAETVFDHIESLEVDGPPFTLNGRADTYQAKAVVAATGARAKTLGVPGEEKFWGRGVSTCATCDAAFFADAPTALVGGGDSAMQEGLFLARFASKVYVIHRRDQLRAGATLAERAFSEPKLEFVWDSVVEEIAGENVVEHVRVRNLKTGQTSELPVEGFFIFIGHDPNTELYRDKLALKPGGYLKADEMMHTSVPGIFAAGEVQDDHFRQAATSAGEGVKAAMEAIHFVENLPSPATKPGVLAGSG